MGRSPCCDKSQTNKGPWTKEEDERLVAYIRANGEGCWRSLPKSAGLLRCGKSCRMRWINYLRPDVKRGNFTEEEDALIIKLQSSLGNKWSAIARRLPGRSDNEIKNYWNSHIKKKLINMGLDPQTHRPINATQSDGRSSLNSVTVQPKPTNQLDPRFANIAFSKLPSSSSEDANIRSTTTTEKSRQLFRNVDIERSMSFPSDESPGQSQSSVLIDNIDSRQNRSEGSSETSLNLAAVTRDTPVQSRSNICLCRLLGIQISNDQACCCNLQDITNIPTIVLPPILQCSSLLPLLRSQN